MIDQEWQQILSRLLEDRDRLVDDFLERLTESRIYGSLALSKGDLEQAASDTLELLIRRLAGLPTGPVLASVPEALGVRRARQGVAQAALMEAVRLDFRVLWGGLVRASEHSSADVLVRHAEDVLSTVERYIGEVQTAFLAETAALVHDERAHNRRALLRLIAAGEDLPEVAGEVASALRLPADAALELVYVRASSSQQARRLVDATHKQSDYLSADMDDGTVFLRRHETGVPLATTLAQCPGGLIPSVDGLVAIPAAIQLGARISRHSTGDALRQEQDVWLALAHSEIGKALPTLSARTALLDTLPSTDRSRLIETVGVFCATGSIKRTAELLYCHRNTIVNRLRQITEITGCDLTVPLQAAQLLLALGAEMNLAQPVL